MHRSNRTLAQAAALVLATAVAPHAGAQVSPWTFTWKWDQSWDSSTQLESDPSVVETCAGTPVPFAPRAFDDWRCGQTGENVRLQWWGTSEDPVTPATRFLIRIFTPSAMVACRPGAKVWEACGDVTPTLVGTDCTGRSVWRYSIRLATFHPNGLVFNQTVEEQYWLSICEVDNDPGAPSPSVGAVDFSWSHHQPVQECPALTYGVAGFVTVPLIDACNMTASDLAFRWRSRSVSGDIEAPGGIGGAGGLGGIFGLAFHDAATLQLRDVVIVRPNSRGEFDLDPNLPDGPYRLVIRGMGGVAQDLGIINLTNGEDLDLGTITLGGGDANGDNAVNFQDITRVLTHFGATGFPGN